MEDALRDSDVIWNAILQWSEMERWPRLKRPAAYFLRERLLSAQARTGILEFPIGTRFQRSSLPESRATEILRSLLVDDWRERAVQRIGQRRSYKRERSMIPGADPTFQKTYMTDATQPPNQAMQRTASRSDV